VLPPAAAQVQPLVECFFVLADIQVRASIINVHHPAAAILA